MNKIFKLLVSEFSNEPEYRIFENETKTEALTEKVQICKYLARKR